MNYTLKELRDRVNKMIEQQAKMHTVVHGSTPKRLSLKDEDGNIDYDNTVEDPDVIERIFDDVGNIDYIYR